MTWFELAMIGLAGGIILVLAIKLAIKYRRK